MKSVMMYILTMIGCIDNNPKPPSITIVYDETLKNARNGQGEADIVMGSHFWDIVGVAVETDLEIKTDYTVTFVATNSNPIEGIPNNWGGYTTNHGVQIHLDNWEGQNTDVARTVIAHELGHAMGLWHVNDESAVMNPYCHGLGGINSTDMTEFHRVWQ